MIFYLIISFLAAYFSLIYMSLTINQAQEFADDMLSEGSDTETLSISKQDGPDSDFKLYHAYKSPRELIQLIAEYPLSKIAPKYHDLKGRIKMPMLGLITACALQSSLN
jgi:hypothetical protein